MKTFVVIPCYRCSAQIKRVLRVFSDPKLSSNISKILIVDNCSPDNTRESIIQAVKDFKLEHLAKIYFNRQNYGLGGSQKIAIKLALQDKADCLAILHGDDQGDPKELPLLINEAELNPKYAAILGSRFSINSTRLGYQKKRVWGNLGLNTLYTLLTGRWTPDLGSGINVYRCQALAQVPWNTLGDHFAFNTDLLLNLYKKGCRVKFFPITWREEDQQSNARNFSVAWEILCLLLKWRFNVKTQKTALDYQTEEISF